MLLQFNFSNYKSFHDEASLDLSATGISELSHHVVQLANEKVLPISAIFGANASGKSNVYKAFSYMKHLVVRSFQYGGATETVKATDESSNFPQPPRFAWTKQNNKPASFEVYLLDPLTLKTSNYGFSIDEKGIVEEWLNEKAKTARKSKNVFFRSRNEQENDFSGLSKADTNNLLTALEPEVLVISLGNKLKVHTCQAIVQWFYQCETIDYGDPSENYFLCNRLPNNFKEKEIQDRVITFFASFDETIKGFKIEELPSEDEDAPKRIYIESLHQAIDSEDLIGIGLHYESSGTIKMFSLYPVLMNVLEHGTVLFVDELNSRLHPLLVRNLIRLFSDPRTNPNHAQLLFTTHDTWHLANKSLRRDEIWFTGKNSKGESSLYSLADFKPEEGTKIRKDEHYEKNYLLGKYGAIPSVSTMQILFPDDSAAEGEQLYE
ncbi:MAG: ATP-binding protein [Sphaerochaeta sp.]|nr:ATP-binding protein [Sphaerochaeta sp.]